MLAELFGVINIPSSVWIDENGAWLEAPPAAASAADVWVGDSIGVLIVLWALAVAQMMAR